MFQNFFRGRYGMDNFGWFLVIIALIFERFRYLYFLGIIIFLYELYRIFSRDILRRRREAQKFDSVFKKVLPYFEPVINSIKRVFIIISRKFSVYRMRYRQRADYVFLTCPKCRKTLRLPKNKGKLSVTCPVCRHQFYKKT